MIYVRNREEWREWLKRNHLKESKVAIVIYKKHTGKPSLSQRESMEEAICFGWIDTTVKRLDEDRYIRNFSRRTANSRWSRNTRRYARDMMKEGKMSPEGMRRYKEGLARKRRPLSHRGGVDLRLGIVERSGRQIAVLLPFGKAPVGV